MVDEEGREVVTVNKQALLAELIKNREQHQRTFEKALEGWKKKVTETLEKAYEDAKAGRRYENFISLEKPQNQTKDYDRVIKMVEMSVGETVILKKEEFAQYVMDDWRWKDQFTNSTALYMSPRPGDE